MRSSKYWYLSFFLARHSLADWRLRSNLVFMSVLRLFWPGLRPRLDLTTTTGALDDSAPGCAVAVVAARDAADLSVLRSPGRDL